MCEYEVGWEFAYEDGCVNMRTGCTYEGRRDEQGKVNFVIGALAAQCSSICPFASAVFQDTQGITKPSNNCFFVS